MMVQIFHPMVFGAQPVTFKPMVAKSSAASMLARSCSAPEQKSNPRKDGIRKERTRYKPRHLLGQMVLLCTGKSI